MGGQMASNIGYDLWVDKWLQTQDMAYDWTNGFKHRTWLMGGQMASNIRHGL